MSYFIKRNKTRVEDADLTAFTDSAEKLLIQKQDNSPINRGGLRFKSLNIISLEAILKSVFEIRLISENQRSIFELNK